MHADLPLWRQHVGWRARLEYELGGGEAADRYLATYLAELQRIGIGPNHESVNAVETLEWIARLTGSTAAATAARRAIEAWPDDWGESGEVDAGPWSWWRTILAMGIALDGALRAKVRTAEHVRSWLTRFAGNWGLGFCLSKGEALGLLDLTIGDANAAVAHFQQALSIYRRASMRPSMAWACSECAEALIARGAAGDGEQAEELLREGLAIARSLGMPPLAQRIRGLQHRR